jgi:hypothetical protein
LDLTVFDGDSSSEAQKKAGATSVLHQAGVTEDKTFVGAGIQFPIDAVAACTDLVDGWKTPIRNRAIADYQPPSAEATLKSTTVTCNDDDTAGAGGRRRRQADGVNIRIELVYVVASADTTDLPEALADLEDAIADQIKDAIITVVTAAGKPITVNVAATEVDEVTFAEILDTFLEGNGRMFEFVTTDELEPEMKNAESSPTPPAQPPTVTPEPAGARGESHGHGEAKQKSKKSKKGKKTGTKSKKATEKSDKRAHAKTSQRLNSGKAGSTSANHPTAAFLVTAVVAVLIASGAMIGLVAARRQITRSKQECIITEEPSEITPIFEASAPTLL